jgi:antitoxin component of MazEF toxin-antitoxin module
MMAIPAAALEVAQLSAGASVIVIAEDGKISFRAAKPPSRVGLTARLAKCSDGPFEADSAFLDAARTGREEI